MNRAFSQRSWWQNAGSTGWSAPNWSDASQPDLTQDTDWAGLPILELAQRARPQPVAPAIPAVEPPPMMLLSGVPAFAGDTGFFTSGASAVGSSGDIAINAPAARSQFHLDGTGLRIGIISDSFDAASAQARSLNAATAFSSAVLNEQANGDLPGVVVLSDTWAGLGLSASDEGRAIAELIHKVAPGAQIYFAAAGSNETNSAAAVSSLVAAGANVIIDDISWVTEAFFQDGTALQRAVTAATSAGVSYFTSAGNIGDHYYETTFAARSTQTITFAGGAVLIEMQWSQPFLTAGGPGSAYSLSWQLLIHNTSTVAFSSTVNNDRTGNDPLQWKVIAPAGTFDLVIVNDFGVAVGTDVVKVVFETGNYASIGMAPGTGSGTVFGHQLLDGANVVGAVDSNNPTNVEAFSAYGPGAEYWTPAGVAITPAANAAKPDFLAGDRIVTDVFGTFAGTSAAAPNAAAAGALLLQINPNLTPADLTRILAATANAVGLVGSPDQIGAGLIDTQAAAELIYYGEHVSNGITIYNGTALSFASVRAWNHGSGSWATAADWDAAIVPSATSYVTLGDNLGTLSSSYSVTLAGAGGTVDTLAVGGAAAIGAGLVIAAAGSLSVSEGASLGRAGSLTVTAGATLSIAGLLRLDDVTGATATMTVQVGATLSAGSLNITGGVLTMPGHASIAGNLAVGPGGSLIVAAGGTMTVGGTITSTTGSDIEIGSGARLVEQGVGAGHVTIAYGGTFVVQTSDSEALQQTTKTLLISRANGTGVDFKGHVVLQGTTAGTGQTLFFRTSDSLLFIDQGATKIATLAFDQTQGFLAKSFSLVSDGSGHLQVNIACYLQGTRIGVPGGEMAVERLRIGDLVLTASGTARPIRWIGSRAYGAAETAAEQRLRPIRIGAGALGAGLPRRDLLVSAQHALLLDDPLLGEVLVPAALLADGEGIAGCTDCGDIRYFHVELDSHDAILAEGQPAESFVDRDSRAGFDNAADFRRCYPRGLPAGADYAPRLDGPALLGASGDALARIRAGIAAGAGRQPGALEGQVDRADNEMIEGWATQGQGPVLLEILLDGARAAIVLADQFRADLRAMQGGNCAFYFAVPAGLRPGAVEVRRLSDGARLSMPEPQRRVA